MSTSGSRPSGSLHPASPTESFVCKHKKKTTPHRTHMGRPASKHIKTENTLGAHAGRLQALERPAGLACAPERPEIGLRGLRGLRQPGTGLATPPTISSNIKNPPSRSHTNRQNWCLSLPLPVFKLPCLHLIYIYIYVQQQTRVYV